MTSSDLIKVKNSLSKASDYREDTVMLSQGNANWEEYLTPAPMSICFLGQLVRISSKQDFSIKEGGPIDGFKHIKYPDSFRASLMQVCNSGWRAFNEAHKNMDQIYLHTKNVPTYISTAVKVLLKEDDELIQSVLPDTLQNIDDISKECVALATSVEKKFCDVTDLISELVETCTSSQQKYGSHLKEVRQTLEDEKLRKDMLEEEKRLAEKAFRDMEQELQEAKTNFNKAIDSMPTGMEICLMNLVEGLTNSVNTLMSGLATSATRTGYNHSVVQRENSSPCGENIFDVNTIVSKSCILLSTAQELSTFIEGEQIQWSKIIDETNGESRTDWLQKRVEDVTTHIKDVNDCKQKKQALKICELMIDICSNLTALARTGKHGGNAKNKQLIKQINNVVKLAKMFDSSTKKTTNASAFTATPPGLNKVQSSTSVGQTMVENARLRINQMEAQLSQAKQMKEKTIENMEQKNRNLTESLNKLRRCDIQEIDFVTTIKMLADGLKAMGELKEQWCKMVQFFQLVSNYIKTCLKTSLKDFIQTAGKPTPKNLKYTSKMFLSDMIYQQAFQASNIANMVNMISGTYTELSSKYLMDKVSSLGTLMSLDPNDPCFEIKHQSLYTGCEDAEREIRALVLENKRRYDEKTAERFQKIESALKAVLPQQSVEEERETRAIVNAGFQEDDDSEEMTQYC